MEITMIGNYSATEIMRYNSFTELLTHITQKSIITTHEEEI